MSSHHIVRDGQEPALILHHVRYQDYPLVMNLMEWSPIVILMEEAAHQITEWGIKIDCIVAQHRLNEISKLLAVQKPFQELSGGVTEAILYAKNKGAGAINYIGDFHQMQSFNSSLPLVIYNDGFQYSYFEKKFSKWMNSTTFCEVISEEKTENINLSEDHSINEGFVTVSSENGFWIKEKW